MTEGIITIFTTTTCSYCTKAKELLATKPVKVISIVIDTMENSSEVRLLLNNISKAKTVPQIFLNYTLLPGGFSNLKQLEDRGELDSVLDSGLKINPMLSGDVAYIIQELKKKYEEELLDF